MLKAPIWSICLRHGLSFSQQEALYIVGHSLRKLYGEVLEEDLPDHLWSAVEKLQAREREALHSSER